MASSKKAEIAEDRPPAEAVKRAVFSGDMGLDAAAKETLKASEAARTAAVASASTMAEIIASAEREAREAAELARLEAEARKLVRGDGAIDWQGLVARYMPGSGAGLRQMAVGDIRRAAEAMAAGRVVFELQRLQQVLAASEGSR